jgi:prepilin-type N-terminal cleavage/methylation domain-containing protein
MKLKNFFKKAKGFTLVELIAVVSVILILVAIVVPRIGDLRGQASNARAQSNAKIVQGAIERAAVEGALTAANATDQASVYTVLTTATNGMSGAPYLSEVPNPTPAITGRSPTSRAPRKWSAHAGPPRATAGVLRLCVFFEFRRLKDLE